MAPSQNTESDVTGATQSGLLFKNIAFWLSSTVPQRSRFKELIEEHGGKVVNLEKKADYRLVDHFKPNLAAGTYSYQFVEKSIRNKKLENPEDHLAGPSTNNVRPVGSTTIRTKSTRKPFTAQDDKILYDWMKPFEEEGGKFRGNKVYQQLEEKHPEHTWQSWRDRWLRVRTESRLVTSKPPGRGTGQEFTTADKQKLLDVMDEILDVEPSLVDEAWSKFTEANPEHSAKEWENYFNTTIRPRRVRRNERQEVSASSGNGFTKQLTQALQSAPSKRKESPLLGSRPAMGNRAGRKPTERVSEEEETNENQATSSKGKRKRSTLSLSPESVEQVPHMSVKKKKKPSSPISLPITQEQSVSIETSEDDEFETAPQYPERYSTQLSEGHNTQEATVDKALQNIIIDSDSEDEDGNEGDIEDAQYLDNWIESRVKSGKGADECQVLKALHYTTLDLDLADKILPYIKSGKDIPTMKGVWTEEDDRCMEGEDARVIKELGRKHGSDALIRRLEHLGEWRAELEGSSSQT